MSEFVCGGVTRDGSHRPREMGSLRSSGERVLSDPMPAPGGRRFPISHKHRSQESLDLRGDVAWGAPPRDEICLCPQVHRSCPSPQSQYGEPYSPSSHTQRERETPLSCSAISQVIPEKPQAVLYSFIIANSHLSVWTARPALFDARVPFA